VKTIVVYDKPMCCATGVCGPEVDPVLPRFAADLQWLQSQGHRVERFNLAHQPGAFLQNLEVNQLLNALGPDCLPLIVIDGQLASRGSYLSREALAACIETGIKSVLPIAGSGSECCGGAACG
jgi:arsenite methyltransferase